MRRLCALVPMFLATGCIYPRILNPDVVGPHREHLVEVECLVPHECLDLARATCHADYDIVTNNDSVGNSAGRGVASTTVMLVQCKPTVEPAPASPAVQPVAPAPAAPAAPTPATTPVPAAPAK